MIITYTYIDIYYMFEDVQNFEIYSPQYKMKMMIFDEKES